MRKDEFCLRRVMALPFPVSAMRKKIPGLLKLGITALLSLISIDGANAQSFPTVNWLQNGTGTGGADEGRSVAYDASGNMYLAGYFSGEFNPDNSGATTNYILESNGGTDIYLAKYNTSGTLVWAFGVGGAGSDQLNGIVLDGSGNVYVAGYITGTTSTNIDADPSSNTNNVAGASASSSTDHFIAKYDGTLTPSSTSFYKWAFTTGDASADVLNSITLDGSGNLYVAGYITGTTSTNIDADPSSSTNNVTGRTASSSSDIFIAKYDGTLIPSSTSFYKWAFTTGGTGSDLISGIAVDGSGYVYAAGNITGTTSTSIDADPSSTTNNVTGATVTSSSDQFVAKYDGTLVPSNTSFYQWAFTTGGAGADVLNGVAVDGSGNVFVAGAITGTTSTNIDADPSSGTNNVTGATVTSSQDQFMGKYDGTLAPSNTSFYKWAFTTGGTGSDATTGITVDGSSNVYVAGYITGTTGTSIDADPSSNTNNIAGASATSSTDMFMAKYDGTQLSSSTSFYKWAFTMGGVNADVLNGITLSSTRIYTAGGVASSPIDVDPSTNINNIIPNLSTTSDIVGMAYDATTTPSSTSFYRAAIYAGNSNSTPEIRATAIDASGNVYAAGSFGGTMYLGGITMQSKGGQDMYISKYNAAGTLLWAFPIGSTLTDEIFGITVDGSGNIYVAGYISGTTPIDADPSSNTNNVTGNGSNDQFIAKYDGNFSPSSTSFYKWAFVVGAGSIDRAQAIAVDANGYVYVAGNITGSTATNIDADPSSNTNNVTGVHTSSSTDQYVAKYDGTLDPTNTSFYKWAFTTGGNAVTQDRLYSIAVDASGNVYVAGQVAGTTSTTIDADPSSNTHNVTGATAVNGTDNFIAKYDGTLLPSSTSFYKWAFVTGSTGGDGLNSLAIDGSGNVYIAGYIQATNAMNIDADPSSNTNNVTGLGAVASQDYFIAKYNGNLDPSSTSFYKWAFTMGSDNSDILNAMTVDNSGYMYLAGYTNATNAMNIDVDPSSNTNNVTGSSSSAIFNQFVAKYNANLLPSSTGFYKWAYIAGSTTGSSELYAISRRNNIMVTGGFFTGINVDFQAGSNNSTLTSAQNGAAQAIFLGTHHEGFTWTGAASTDWNTSGNWLEASVPTAGEDVYIPATGVTNEPAISSNNSLNDLTIDAGRTLTINSGNSLSATGTITNNATITSDGKLSLNGTDLQSIYGNGTYNNLELDNSNGSTVAANAQVNITGSLSLITGTLTTNDKLTLKSSSITNTAIIGPVSGAITGNVTGERFIPAKRAYRFLTSGVTTTTTIRNNWQEGGNNVPGLGTHITGSASGANGFDATFTGNPSMYTYNSGTQLWQNIANTNVNTLTNGTGYRLMIRGDRTVSLATNTPTPTNTVLRATGTIRTGSVTYNTTGAASTPVLGSAVADYSLIGNPYIAPVDWNALTTNDLEATYHMWDPTLAGANGFGAYVSYNTLTGSSNASSDVDEFIQPYQAVFVVTSGPSPSITFTEANKSTGLTGVFKNSPKEELFVQLFRAGQSIKSADGVKVVFDSSFAKTIGREDAAKLTNVDENIAIQYDTAHLLSISGVPQLVGNDTVRLKMWKMESNGNYELNLLSRHFSTELEAWLIDNYLKQQQVVKLDDSISYSFTTITGDGSSDPNRFMIVFKRASTGIAKTNKEFNNSSLTIYPNPVENNTFNIQLQDISIGNYNLNIYNSIGQLVYTTTINHTATSGKHQVKLDKQIPSGIYTVEVTNGTAIVNCKISF